MKKTTRYHLIEYMRTRKVVSAVELARVFKISAADARHHLASMEDEGVVAVVDTRAHGRGRPTQLYRLTCDINRNNLGALCYAALSAALDGIPEHGRDAVLQKIAADLAGGFPRKDGNLTHRLAYAVRCLNEMNYQARWEAHIDAPRILISHCPYSKVASSHPEICRMDALVINKVLGQPVTLSNTTGNVETGEQLCVFRLKASQTLAIDTEIGAM